MLRWSPPSKAKPTTESKRFFSPTPDDLRTLVFDYLCHGSYTSTARAFMKDSVMQRTDGDEDDSMDVDEGAMDSPIDLAGEERLRLAQLRREVKVKILSGMVDDAITFLKIHFPAVLSHCPHNHSMHSSAAASDTFTYIAPRSVDPTHLLLDLHILGFIEAARTTPLPYYPPGSSAPSPSSLSHNLPTFPRTSHVREESEPNAQQQILLHKAQKLYSDANCLPKPEDRALYLKELAHVSALLAYPVPEESPLAGYLAQARREEMADQIEGAILHHTGELAASKIELGVRYTSVVWNWMNAKDVFLPPAVKWPPGVQPPPDTLSPSTSAQSAEEQTSSGKKLPDKEGEPTVPLFHLAHFLGDRPR